eukprot:5969809-Karenia_brevis.AAC.1
MTTKSDVRLERPDSTSKAAGGYTPVKQLVALGRKRFGRPCSCSTDPRTSSSFMVTPARSA